MSWTVLHTRPRCEKKVAEICKLGNISYYLPLRTDVRKYQRREVEITNPLFPGYIFANLSPQQRLAILKTNNILRTLPARNQRRLKRELVYVRQALRKAPSLKALPQIKEGMHVHIKSGSFRGIEGTATRLATKTRVRISVNLIGQYVAVMVKKTDLEIIDQIRE